ncbi:hypothetical protein CIL05_06195 [Virgibacillus profundi]|uniref:PepSY domain-containing protein n=1 Tax=Virgibacillus profundi TaxID=2024555 RepID=A0A2A2IFZ7_9BACI|nr:PepSY domain-containing protein [Virgibacillus profundi]PAV30689.1 hypothetical protein CIL05_06195 [Virgibacillus profundi]PXY54861.1 hypothetical protein CIT14_06280 [Virgibacillus profundi]
MKKKLAIAIGTLTGAAVIGLGVYQTDAIKADPKLASDEIRDMISDQYEGSITEFELEKEFNKVVYEVEVEGNGKEYDLKIDGDTGEVLKENTKETKTNDVPTKEQDVKTSNKDVIGIEKAEEVALKEFAGTITDLELDEDDGRLVYEIEIENGKKEADFEIDALTGEILEMEIDLEEDDD